MIINEINPSKSITIHAEETAVNKYNNYDGVEVSIFHRTVKITNNKVHSIYLLTMVINPGESVTITIPKDKTSHTIKLNW
jgi:hypothetical protein